MMTGIQLIAKERLEQIEKHGKTPEHDVLNNNEQQLVEAAFVLISDPEEGFPFPVETLCPLEWDKEVFKRMMNKPHRERLIIAGALIAAELDRLNAKNG